MLLIKNGTVVDPASGREGKADVLIKDDRILRIGPNISPAEGDTVIDATGRIVAPGFVDVHVHFRDPGFTDKEDILTGAAAAAKGGFTSVVMMADTKPTIDNPETLKYVLEKGATTGIHCYACVNVTKGIKGQELTDMEELSELGAVGFTDDGIPLVDENIVREAMERSGRIGKPISFHEENPALIENNGVNRGKASEFYGIGGSPREAEISLIERDLKLAEGTGACIDIQHISTEEGVQLVREAKARGLDVHAEATPHHFTLTEDAVIEHGTLAKMNPPLRLESDRMAIIRGLQDGTIDMIATDHAPHTAEEKARDITKAPSGIIGLETSYCLGFTELVKKGYLTRVDLFKLMSTNPAHVYHLDAGYLAENGPADLVLVVEDEETTIDNKCFASKAVNSPFVGQKYFGVVEKTICGGKLVYSRT
jgi:dihydroorotase